MRAKAPTSPNFSPHSFCHYYRYWFFIGIHGYIQYRQAECKDFISKFKMKCVSQRMIYTPLVPVWYDMIEFLQTRRWRSSGAVSEQPVDCWLKLATLLVTWIKEGWVYTNISSAYAICSELSTGRAEYCTHGTFLLYLLSQSRPKVVCNVVRIKNWTTPKNNINSLISTLIAINFCSEQLLTKVWETVGIVLPWFHYYRPRRRTRTTWLHHRFLDCVCRDPSIAFNRHKVSWMPLIAF